MTKSDRDRWTFGIVANATIVALVVLFWVLQVYAPLSHYAAVQEDGILEWISFWGFLLGACAFFEATRRQHGAGDRIPWFTAGVGLFCFLVAMEEISWGQRLLGYRPPVYFLENNYQQEFNLHNVMDSDLRARAVEATIFLYGVLLPLLARFAPTKRFMERVGVHAPPPLLVPAFTVMFVFYVWDPWRYLAEVVEAMLGLGFMFAGLQMVEAAPSQSPARYVAPAGLAVALCAVGSLSVASAAFSQSPRGVHPGDLKAAIAETKMLGKDFLAIWEETGELPSECGVHDRLYNFAWDYDVEYLARGAFAELVAQGLPQERADFFIDPWDTAYWVRDRCDEHGERVVFVYSMGPNRRRDSTKWRLRGDDIGVYIMGGPPELASAVTAAVR